MKLPGIMISDVRKSFLRKPVTQLYPFERHEAPERLRGLLNWNGENCTGCNICSMDCPAKAIEVVVIDKKAKRFVMHYQADRCTFCAQCVFSCNHDCISLDNDGWELAALGKDAFAIYYGTDDDVEYVLAGPPAPDAEAPVEG